MENPIAKRPTVKIILTVAAGVAVGMALYQGFLWAKNKYGSSNTTPTV